MIQLTAKRAVFSKVFSNQLQQQSALNKSVEAVGVWSAAEELIHDVRRWTDSTLAFFRAYDLSGKLNLAFRPLKVGFARINEWQDSFFVEFHNPATGNLGKAMKPSAFEGVNKWMDGLTGFVRKVDTFIESQMVKDLMGFSWDQLGFAFNDIFKNLEELATLYLDIKTGQ